MSEVISSLGVAILAPNEVQQRQENYTQIQRGITGKKFQEYYDEADDATLLGTERPYTYRARKRTDERATRRVQEKDQEEHGGMGVGALELFRAAGAVPDMFRALGLRDEVEAYGNVTAAARRDVLNKAGEDAKALEKKDVSQDDWANGALAKRVHAAWERAVRLQLPNRRQQRIRARDRNGFGNPTAKMAGVDVYAIMDGGRRTGWDWVRNAEQGREKNFVLLNVETTRGVLSSLVPRGRGETTLPFFFDPADAQALLEEIKRGEGKRARAWSVEPMSLTVPYSLSTVPREKRPRNLAQTTVLYVPREKDVRAMRALLRRNGIDESRAGGIPLFQARGLTIPAKDSGQSGLVPLFFSFEDCAAAFANAKRKFQMQKEWGVWEDKDSATAAGSMPEKLEVDVGQFGDFIERVYTASPSSSISGSVLVGPGLMDLDNARTERMLALDKALRAEHPKGSLHHTSYKDSVLSMRMRDLMGGFANLDDAAVTSMLKKMYQQTPEAFSDPDIARSEAWNLMRENTRGELVDKYNSNDELQWKPNEPPMFNARAVDPWLFPRPGDKAKIFEADIDRTHRTLTQVPVPGDEERMLRHLYGRDQYLKDIKEQNRGLFKQCSDEKQKAHDEHEYIHKFAQRYRSLYGEHDRSTPIKSVVKPRPTKQNAVVKDSAVVATKTAVADTTKTTTTTKTATTTSSKKKKTKNKKNKEKSS